MATLALPSSEHLALPAGPVMRGSTDTHNDVRSLLGNVLEGSETVLKQGAGLLANATGRVIRFVTDTTLTTAKNLLGGFLKRPHS